MIDRNCCVSYVHDPHSYCSAFHSSIVKVPPETSLACFLLPFRDRYRTPGTTFLRIEDYTVLGSLFLRRNLLGGLLTRSCLPVVIGNIGIMP